MESIKSILDKIKEMVYFDIVIDLEEPLHFNGVLPFDVFINDNVATFRVLAHSHEEAEHKVFKFLWGEA
jgi:hypothetical protein